MYVHDSYVNTFSASVVKYKHNDVVWKYIGHWGGESIFSHKRYQINVLIHCWIIGSLLY